MQGNVRMTIGQSLAEARGRAGLSIAAVEEHTRIRGQVIAAIEQDEFGPCGGDFYARGHVRQLARVVGLDPQPLLAQFPASAPEVPEPVSELESIPSSLPKPTAGPTAGPSAYGAPEPAEPSTETVAPHIRWTLLMALASTLVLLVGITQSVT